MTLRKLAVYIRKAPTLWQRLGERWGMARSATDLGYLACDQEDEPVTAESLFEEALENFPGLGA